MSKFAYENKDNPVVHRAHLGCVLNMVNAAIAVLEHVPETGAWILDLRIIAREISQELDED